MWRATTGWETAIIARSGCMRDAIGGRLIRFDGPWSFDNEEWKGHVRGSPAVYRLRAWDSAAGRPRVIGRAGGNDDAGVLDIGTTGGGYGRLLTLLRAARTGRGSHAAGLKFHGYEFAAVFPLPTLRIEVAHLSSNKLAEAVELRLIEDYLYAFKDLPPLNSTQGNWRSVERWLEGQGRAARINDEVNLAGLLPLDLLLDPTTT